MIVCWSYRKFTLELEASLSSCVTGVMTSLENNLTLITNEMSSVPATPPYNIIWLLLSSKLRKKNQSRFVIYFLLENSPKKFHQEFFTFFNISFASYFIISYGNLPLKHLKNLRILDFDDFCMKEHTWLPHLQTIKTNCLLHKVTWWTLI